MNELEWDILDQAYFMNSYNAMREAVPATAEAFDAALVTLLQDGLLRQLAYSDRHADFVDVEPVDPALLHRSQFVITKKGLLAHTGSV